jgi:hypothetical protein
VDMSLVRQLWQCGVWPTENDQESTIDLLWRAVSQTIRRRSALQKLHYIPTRASSRAITHGSCVEKTSLVV